MVSRLGLAVALLLCLGVEGIPIEQANLGEQQLDAEAQAVAFEQELKASNAKANHQKGMAEIFSSLVSKQAAVNSALLGQTRKVEQRLRRLNQEEHQDLQDDHQLLDELKSVELSVAEQHTVQNDHKTLGEDSSVEPAVKQHIHQGLQRVGAEMKALASKEHKTSLLAAAAEGKASKLRRVVMADSDKITKLATNLQKMLVQLARIDPKHKNDHADSLRTLKNAAAKQREILGVLEKVRLIAEKEKRISEADGHEQHRRMKILEDILGERKQHSEDLGESSEITQSLCDSIQDGALKESCYKKHASFNLELARIDSETIPRVEKQAARLGIEAAEKAADLKLKALDASKAAQVRQKKNALKHENHDLRQQVRKDHAQIKELEKLVQTAIAREKKMEKQVTILNHPQKIIQSKAVVKLSKHEVAPGSKPASKAGTHVDPKPPSTPTNTDHHKKKDTAPKPASTVPTPDVPASAQAEPVHSIPRSTKPVHNRPRSTKPVQHKQHVTLPLGQIRQQLSQEDAMTDAELRANKKMYVQSTELEQTLSKMSNSS